MMHYNTLLIFRNGPFENNKNSDCLDIALACSAFDIPISLLFIGDAVLQLTRDLESQIIAQKNIANTLRALEMYDIDKIYVSAADLSRFNLDESSLIVSCNILEQADIALLIRRQDKVINL
jgi:tRNA 2-thiouridine synthesizing protein C